jgi:YidC/Oxa1 family membrane protein insertase
VVFGVLSLRFASGLVVYWVTSNLWRIGQQHLVLNKIYDEAQNAPPLKARTDDEDPEPPLSLEKGTGGKPAGSGGPKAGGGPKGAGGGTPKPAVRRPGSPKPARDPNRTNGAGGSGNGAAGTPTSAGNRRKKRKR